MLALTPEAHVLRVVDEHDVVRGTGFVVGVSGEVLTCHHVVDGLDGVRLVSPTGVSVDIALERMVSVPERDLALLPASEMLGIVLPVSVRGPRVGSHFVTAGYHRLSASIRSAFVPGGGGDPRSRSRAVRERVRGIRPH